VIPRVISAPWKVNVKGGLIMKSGEQGGSAMILSLFPRVIAKLLLSFPARRKTGLATGGRLC